MRYCCSLGLRGILLFSFLLGFKLKNSLSILLSSRDVSSLLHFSQWAWILFDLVILHWGVGFKQSRNSKNKSPETPTAKQKNKKKRTQPEKTQKGRELKTTFKSFFFLFLATNLKKKNLGAFNLMKGFDTKEELTKKVPTKQKIYFNFFFFVPPSLCSLLRLSDSVNSRGEELSLQLNGPHPTPSFFFSLGSQLWSKVRTGKKNYR